MYSIIIIITITVVIIIIIWSTCWLQKGTLINLFKIDTRTYMYIPVKIYHDIPHFVFHQFETSLDLKNYLIYTLACLSRNYTAL